MPWCPKCKMEYKEGITVCSDCKVELVDNLTDEVTYLTLAKAEDEAFLKKFQAYLEYSKIPSNVTYLEEELIHSIEVPEEQLDEAKKLFQAFYRVESEKKLAEAAKQANASSTEELEDATNSMPEEVSDMNEDCGETDDLEAENAANDEEDAEEDPYSVYHTEGGTYEMKSDRYKDNKSTAWMFLFFGIAGLIFVALNLLDVIHYLSVISCIFMAIVFVIFFFIAYVSFKKANELATQVDAEEELTKNINEYLVSHITKEYLESIRDHSVNDEINYFHTMQIIKENLTKEFGAQDPAYLDRLVDEFYNEHFEEA